MATKNMVIRSTKANPTDPGARYVSYAPGHAGKLVGLADAQRFTEKQAADHVAKMCDCGEWSRGDYRKVSLADARALRDGYAT